MVGSTLSLLLSEVAHPCLLLLILKTFMSNGDGDSVHATGELLEVE